MGFFNNLISTKDSYDLSILNLSKLRCASWDDVKYIWKMLQDKNLEKTDKYSEKRNLSMIEVIRSQINYDTNLPLIITAGILHLPITSQVYLHKPSQVIYDYLNNNKINYEEYIHKLMLK